LYGCETWSLTLREEQRLRVLENSMVRRTFGPEKDEVTAASGLVFFTNFINVYYSTTTRMQNEIDILLAP
jgi:hypothetical protein